MLQSENNILRKKLKQEEQIEVKQLLNKEINKMGVEELKTKIMKLAEVYRDERVRNEEFEKALRNAQKDLNQQNNLEEQLAEQQKQHQHMATKLLDLQKQANKTNLYRNTI